MDAFFIFGAKYLFLLAPVVALWVFWFLPRSEKKRFVVMLAAVCVAAIIIAKIAGAIYYDPQPFVVGNFIPLIEHSIDNGFPSDHTLFVAAISAVVWYFNRRAGLWLFLLAIVVGL